jgi:response regulator RpfG family c-di-GMP phosphodiesterase
MIKSLNILLIDDDIIEVMKLNRVISSLQLNHKIIESENGEEALKLLEQKDKRPDIILLDLNMPKLSGIDFLSILKKSEDLKCIPTIVLSTSNTPNDIVKCYKTGISGYVIKPLKYEDYVSNIEKLLAYWSINEIFKK